VFIIFFIYLLLVDDEPELRELELLELEDRDELDELLADELPLADELLLLELAGAEYDLLRLDDEGDDDDVRLLTFDREPDELLLELF